MSYGVTLYNVFIASPSDVNWARVQIRDTVQVWNEVHTKHTSSILFPLGWDRNTAPNMGMPAQALINEKLVSEADLLIGVFWTRLGTPTEEYDSGTVEEIELHIKAGKPTLLYFSDEPVAIASIDPAEFARLQAFKEACKNRGIYHRFDSPQQFAEDLNKHLSMHVNELLARDAKPPAQAVSAVGIAVAPVASGPELTDEAKKLLKEASLDSHGQVLHIRYLGGVSIQANGKNLISSDGRREVARWESALHDLVREGLLIGRGSKGEVFEITERGYTVADAL